MTAKPIAITIEYVEQRIQLIRGHRVIIDADLAELYGVPTKRLKEQVRRNPDRFPADFMFQLTWREVTDSRSQFATLNQGDNTKYLPYAFTEHGAIMAANVLNSNTAIQASLYVVRAFVRIRQVLAAHKELARKLAELERRLDTHDESIQSILAAIRELTSPPAKSRRRIGFGKEPL